MIILRYASIDGFRKSYRYKSLAGARKKLDDLLGANYDRGSFYAVSGDGIGRVMVEGASLADLLAKPAAPAIDPNDNPFEPDDRDPHDRADVRGPEFSADVSLEERWAHYAFEERNGMPYGSSF